MNEDRPVATSEETRADLLRLSGSGYTKVRHILRQLPPDGDNSRISVLGPMVTDRKRRALQLYLLLLTAWPWLRNQDRPLDARVWARALSTTNGRKWSPTNVSTAWRDLEQRSLVTRTRVARGVWVEPRREDGRAPYVIPSPVNGDDLLETYFVLPPEFWTKEYFEQLSLPGMAVLLILLGETNKKDEAWFTHVTMGKWYGLSTRSVASALSELETIGILNAREEWVRAPLSGIGHTQRTWYSLTGSFSTGSRAALRARAQAERASRTAATGGGEGA